MWIGNSTSSNTSEANALSLFCCFMEYKKENHMKRKIAFGLSVLLLSFTLISCKNDRIQGVYHYVESENKDDNNIFRMGIRLRCALIGEVEFKKGKCYVNIGGIEKRLDYEIEGNEIYVKNDDGTEDVIKIVDNNTIIVAGCTFKKDKNN